MKNSFALHQPRFYPAPGYITWDPHDDDDTPDPLCTFWGRVLRRVDDAFPKRGLQFYVSWDNDTIPTVGANVVVIQVTDDRGRLPAYSADVAVVFKQFGTKYPFPIPRFEASPYYLNNIFTAIAATLLRRIPYALKVYRRTFAGKKARVLSLPGGYFHSSDETPKPIAERAYDVAFLGSLEGNSKYFARVPSVKSQVRSRMLRALERTASLFPNLVVKTRLMKKYTDAIVTSPEEYTNALFESKICLSPQGLASESYRFHEAVRAGAVVISGKMPAYEYFRGMPTVTVDSWDELPALIPSLLSDPYRLQMIQEASLAWWAANCSERAVAFKMIEFMRETALGGPI